MASAEQSNHAKSFLRKAEEYLASAEDNLAAGRLTPAAGDAIHAGISAKDAVVTALTGSTTRAKAHGAAAKELRQSLGERPAAAAAESSLRQLLSNKSDMECGAALVSRAEARTLLRRAGTLVDLAVQIVRLGR